VQAVTLNGTCAAGPANTGGTVTVNGIVINVPTETIVQFPASTQTWLSTLCPQPSTNSAAPAPGVGKYIPYSPALALSTTDATAGGGSAGNPAVAPAVGAPPMSPSMEITVIGNVIGGGGAGTPNTGPVLNGSDGVYTASLIYISQNSLNSGQGYISFIDYTDGSMYVTTSAGAGPRRTVRLLINDPNGKYGRPQFSPDARFSVDDQNPTITAADSGYPMCVPRSTNLVVNNATGTFSGTDDPFCPQKNRPRTTGALKDPSALTNRACRVFADAGVTVAAGRLDLAAPAATQIFCSSFVMKAIDGMPGTGAPSFNRGNFPRAGAGLPAGMGTGWLANPAAGDADPRQMAPFEVGDFITWQGTLARGVTSKNLAAPTTSTPDTIWVHTIDANVGIFTQPRTLPAYVRVGEFRIGVDPQPRIAGVAAVAGGVETTNRFVAETSVSDIASVVDFYLHDLVLPTDNRIGDGTIGVDGRLLAVDIAAGRSYNRWLTPEAMTGTLTGQTSATKPLPSASINTVQPFGGGITTQYDGPALGRARIRAVRVPAITPGAACVTGPGSTPASRTGCDITASPTRYLRAVVRQLCAPESQKVSALGAVTPIAKANSPTFLAATDTVEPNFTGINKFGAGAAAGAGVVNVLGASNATAPGTTLVPAGDGSCGQRAQFANGLFTGQYVAPVVEFIFAEKIQTGIPVAPNNFWDIDFLVNGEGGIGGNSGGPQVTQPW
jgi:hypothetical protein